MAYLGISRRAARDIEGIRRFWLPSNIGLQANNKD